MAGSSGDCLTLGGGGSLISDWGTTTIGNSSYYIRLNDDIQVEIDQPYKESNLEWLDRRVKEIRDCWKEG